MKFINSTPFPAKLETGSTGDHEMVGVIAAKLTLLYEDEQLVPITDDQAWPVFDKAFVFDSVILGPELDFRKNGVDILVFGSANSPGGEPVQTLDVGIESGSLHFHTRVFGDRMWQKTDSGLEASDPQPFIRKPLTNDHAFGGMAMFAGAQMAHPVNPDGRGFYLTEEAAEGGVLPNLERPNHLIRSWHDQPRPACFFKPVGNPNLTDMKEATPEDLVPSLMDTLFHQAVPELTAQPQDLENHIRLTGFSPDGDIQFPLPDRNGPVALITIGPLRSRFPSTLSSLVLLVPERIVVATYLCRFRYLFQPSETRIAELQPNDGIMSIPNETDFST